MGMIREKRTKWGEKEVIFLEGYEKCQGMG